MVDIFIPFIANHYDRVRRSFGSLFFQEYFPLRTVLWIEDPCHPQTEEFLNSVWYDPEERKLSPSTSTEPVEVEYCSRGVLARNYQGHTGNAWRARQWIFEWEGKSDFVKMLDDDDILMPWAINVMMEYMTDDIEAVFHPLIGVPGRRLGGIISYSGSACMSGAGQMMLRKSLMDKILSDGFKWDRSHDDREFYAFFRSRGYKHVMTKENMMYLYIK